LPNAEPEEQSPISPLHTATANSVVSHNRTQSVGGTTYDFENVDYDADWALRPPPGSPPSPTDALRSFRDSLGNTNGRVPDFSDAARQFAQRFNGQKGTGGWLRNMVPESVATRLGMRRAGGPAPVVGGGLSNDGVFANVSAKPSRAIQIQEGESSVTWLIIALGRLINISIRVVCDGSLVY
jgi:hypothetical protein